MGTCLQVLCFCILITLTVQEKPWKLLRHRRGVNPTDVKPQDIVERFSREIKNVGSKANRVESLQVSESANESMKDHIFELRERYEDMIDLHSDQHDSICFFGY